MSDDHFNYDELMLNAHRELIRQVLLNVAEDGLPGEHHFFIIFSTTHRGTQISTRLKEQYPSEMTIVLQHQYSHLKILKDRFEIQLSFNRIPELLVIPFDAITGFVDPSVPFGLQLAGNSATGLENSIGMLVPGLAQMPTIDTPQDAEPTHDDEAREEFSDYELHLAEETDDNFESVVDLWDSEETSVPSIMPSKDASHDVNLREADKNADEQETENSSEDDQSPTANIVQLDAFRKKSK